ncbi:hypothetical protein Ahy_A01g004215 isoform C [Arachis hypogaea]|uniref:Uncharacterized protein n=1 Tax=Arachis hypogaea TaxID=3818 RepID=A0A445EVA0_ARAHY|nr:hypothetical protein Ahy_A01g004215 isoform C [Arachis hypogaea]
MTSSSLHPSSNSGVSAAAPLRPFRLPQSKLRPEPQTANGVQVTKLCNEDMDPEANEAIEQSLNGSNIILRFNEKLQTVKDGDGLLNGILGALDSDYSKFSICKKSWTKVQGKDRVYDDCMKEDNGGRIKKTFLQQMGRSWKDTREMLYDSYYKPTLTLEQNLNNRPEKIFREHWRWLIDYRNDPATKCKQNTLNQKKQLYMHTGDSKSLARATEEESQKQRRRVGRGEVWILKHKRRDGTYIHEDAQRIGNALLILGILTVIVLIPSEVLARDLPKTEYTPETVYKIEETRQIAGPTGLGRDVNDLDGGKYNIDQLLSISF